MASDGFSRRRVRRRTSLLACLIALAGAVVPAAQAADRAIAIPATTLDIALGTLAQQTGADIASTETGLARIRVAPLGGRLSLHTALDRLLAGSGYRAIAIDAKSYRVVRGGHRSVVRQAAPASPVAGADIVVTASKQRVTLSRYPGSISILTGLAGPGAPGTTPDLDSAARLLPVLQSTALGNGRDKIFIRGVADSSFNGATQSTASQYFGDVPLVYAGPEPDLRLYDMQDVEVMEGPQGTLYGAGAIGGIIRLTPAPVDLVRAGGAIEAGASLTASGAPGFDLSARVNVPLIDETLGVRGVAYRIRDGGYIDDVGQRRSDVNRTDTAGGRITARFDPGGGWDIELGALTQRITGQDAQYADLAGPLSRSASVPQPYHSQFALGRMVVTKSWDSGVELLSASGISDYHSGDLFDATATAGGAPQIYQTDSSRLLLTQELRVSRSLPGGNRWVIGLTLLQNRDAQARETGLINTPIEIIGVTNVTRSASLFGEGTLAFTRNLSLTLGGRVTVARVDGEPSTRPANNSFIRGRSTRRFDPTAALSWRIAPRLSAFARMQTGYRTGGIAVARGVGRVADFDSDSIIVGEFGLRLLREGETGLALSASTSFARWRDIQADLLNRRGASYTTNLGNARIETLEGSADYVPLPGLHMAAAFLYTQNRVSGALADLSKPDNRRLPETPPIAGNVELSYEWAGGADTRWRIAGRGAYAGRSVLGVGDVLDISQGKYAVAGLDGSWRRHGLTATIGIDNLLDSHANRFAFGNPFTFIARDQMTPVRPRTVRLALARSW